jgi:hypothetical protein
MLRILPEVIFRHIGEYLTTLSLFLDGFTQGRSNDLEENLKSWRNFCNCAKLFKHVKRSTIFYNLNDFFSVIYLTIDNEGQASVTSDCYDPMKAELEMRRLSEIVVSPSQQVSLNIDFEYYFENREIKSRIDMEKFIASHLQKFQEVHSITWSTFAPLVNFSIFQHVYCFNFSGSVSLCDLPSFSRIKSVRCRYKDAVVDLCTLSPCVELNLSMSPGISDVSAISNVTRVNISRCNKIIDVSPLKNVKYLDMAFCTGITDVSMLGEVKALILDYCENISNISALGRVKSLSIRGLSRFCEGGIIPSENTVATFRFSLPFLQLENQVSKFSSKSKKHVVVHKDRSQDGSLLNISATQLSTFVGFPRLTFEGCFSFESICGLARLQTLSLGGIMEIKLLSELPLLSHLTIQGFGDADSLRVPFPLIDYSTLPMLKSLFLLYINESFSQFIVVSPLRNLKITGCFIQSIVLKTSLTSLKIKDCGELNVVDRNSYDLDSFDVC